MPPRDHGSSADATGVFLSYRRADRTAAAVAARLAGRLIGELGGSRVFLDVQAMQGGGPFRLQIQDAIARSAVMLVVIGPNWLTDLQGDRRLNDRQDPVRTEIETGLLRGHLVIPILVDGAPMPQSSDLPPELAQLAELHALPIAHSTHDHDDDVVVRRVVEHLRLITPGRPRVHPRAVAIVVLLVVLLGASFVVFRQSWAADTGTVPPAIALPDLSTTPAGTPALSAPTTPDPVSVAPTVMESGRHTDASIQAAYDEPDGCRNVATITGDLHGDPRAAGRALWVVAVLDASPNVLYYPKTQVSAPDGRFSVTIDLNTDSGNRVGRFGLVVSPDDRARDDMQRSLDADIAKNDSAYTDERRTRLHLGNVELATTPFVSQRC